METPYFKFTGKCIVGFALTLMTAMAGFSSSAQQPPTGTVPAPPAKDAAVTATQFVPFVMNYRPWRGLMMVDAIATGNTPAQFIVATGLNVNTVAPDDAPRLQLAAEDPKVRVLALDNVADAGHGVIKAIAFGTHKEDNVPAAIVDVAAMLSRAPHPDGPTGWLGAPFLARYQVTLDFRNHAVAFDQLTAKFPKETGVVVPVKIRDGRIYIRVAIKGAKPFDALVDTGTIGTLIPASVASAAKLKPTDTVAVARPDGKAAKVARSVVPKLQIGKLELAGIHVAYYSADAPSGGDPNFAVIGMDVLRRYRVTINYARQQMFFAPLLAANPGEDPVSP